MAIGLPFGDHLTAQWMDAIEACPRPIASCLSPRCTARLRWRAKLRLRRARCRGVKLHPEMMRFAPDDPRRCRSAECERLGLPVIFHAGRSGIEPESIRPYADPSLCARDRRTRASVPAGHAGAAVGEAPPQRSNATCGWRSPARARRSSPG
jgi:hypothetical protein